jgi:MerR family copper efflux transcriptional regulator
MNIEWLSLRSGVPADTIRLFEKVGLLAPAGPAGDPDYGEAEFQQVCYLREALTLGLSLGEIREILAFRDRGQPPCEHTKRLLDHQMDKISEKVRLLERMQGEFQKMSRQTRKLTLSKETSCHTIDSSDPHRDAARGHPSGGKAPDEIRIIELEP